MSLKSWVFKFLTYCCFFRQVAPSESAVCRFGFSVWAAERPRGGLRIPAELSGEIVSFPWPEEHLCPAGVHPIQYGTRLKVQCVTQSVSLSSCASSSSGHLKPVTLFDRGGIHVSLHFAVCLPSHPDVAVLVVSTVNTSALHVTDYLFQAAVPKVAPLSFNLHRLKLLVVGASWRVTFALLQTMSVKLQPASGTQLSAYNPLLPPPAISQVLLLANPQEVSLSLHRWPARLSLRVAFLTFDVCPPLFREACVSATSWLWPTETRSCTKAERSTASPTGRLWLAADPTLLLRTQV